MNHSDVSVRVVGGRFRRPSKISFSGFWYFRCRVPQLGRASVWERARLVLPLIKDMRDTLSRHHVTNLNLHSLFSAHCSHADHGFAKGCAFRRIGFTGVLAETSAADVADADWFAPVGCSNPTALVVGHLTEGIQSIATHTQDPDRWGCGKPLQDVWIECIIIRVYLHLNFGGRERDFVRPSFCTSRSHQYGYQYAESRRVCLHRTGAASGQPAGYRFPGVNSASHVALFNLLQNMISGLVNSHMFLCRTSAVVTTLHKRWAALDSLRRREILSSLPATVVSNYAHTIEDLAINKINEGASMKIAQRMHPLVDFVTVLGGIASALDAAFPGSSTIFGVVRSILLASRARVDLQDYIIDLLAERISSSLPLIGKYREHFEHSPELLSVTLDIYGDVLDIGNRAMRFFYDDKGQKEKWHVPLRGGELVIVQA